MNWACSEVVRWQADSEFAVVSLEGLQAATRRYCLKVMNYSIVEVDPKLVFKCWFVTATKMVGLSLELESNLIRVGSLWGSGLII